jgi:hypothetical protein
MVDPRDSGVFCFRACTIEHTLSSPARKKQILTRKHVTVKKGRENELLVDKAPPHGEVLKLSEITCEERLGGLLKSYSRKAA